MQNNGIVQGTSRIPDTDSLMATACAGVGKVGECVCVCVCMCVYYKHLNILQWISSRGGRTWSRDCDNQLTHENELQEGWMDKVAMGTQGFQQYWRCMADKMISYDSSRAKPTTGKISLWVMITNFDRPAKLKSCVPIVTYSMGPSFPLECR